MSYIPFIDEQKLEANSVDSVEFLRGRGEQLKRQGREYLWPSHPGVTVSGNRWYSNYDHEGGYPVKFLQKFFNLDYVDAMTELLGCHLPLNPVEYRPEKKQAYKQFCLPQAHTDMRRVYAYLMKQRCIDREVITHFAKAKALYEDARPTPCSWASMKPERPAAPSRGFAPNSSSAERFSKVLGEQTVLSGSISKGKNDTSQSLQMIGRPLMTPDELKLLSKGQFIVMKTGTHPKRAELRLFLKWGITFGEPYELPEKAARTVKYADKAELEKAITEKYPPPKRPIPTAQEQAQSHPRGM